MKKKSLAKKVIESLSKRNKLEKNNNLKDPLVEYWKGVKSGDIPPPPSEDLLNKILRLR